MVDVPAKNVIIVSSCNLAKEQILGTLQLDTTTSLNAHHLRSHSLDCSLLYYISSAGLRLVGS